MSYDGFTMAWLAGAALILVALFTLLGRKSGKRSLPAKQARAPAE